MAPTRRPGRLTAALSATLVALVAFLAVPARVGAATADEAKLMTLLNSARAAAGAPALALDSTLSSISRQWAQVMAQNNAISHNANVRNSIEAAGLNWRSMGENVGMGPTVESVHQALVNSPNHYTNMVNPSYSKVGIGIATSGGYVWVVQNFLAVAGSAAAPAPTPAPEPTPAPTSPPAPPRPPAPATTTAPRPSTTATTTTAAAPATTTSVAPTTTTVELPPPAGLPLLLAQMVQQVKTLGNKS